MKRAVIAALFSGLFVFAVPSLAFADHAADHNGDCGAKTEKSADHSDQQAPEKHAQGDSEQHDGGEILF